MDFVESWRWLVEHPINDSYPNADGKPNRLGMHDLDIHVTKVNPVTHSIDTNSELNTETAIWLEHGPFADYMVGQEDIYPKGIPEHFRWNRTHDPRLDCGGKTFEEAVISLANLVMEFYGDYEKDTDGYRP